MNFLSNACAKDRMYTAGYPKLAVFFLFCLFVFSGCPANASGPNGAAFPYVKDGKLFSFNVADDKTASDNSLISVKSYDFSGNSDSFMQKAVCASKKEGWIIAWNKKTQQLYHIDNNRIRRSRVFLGGALVYTDKKYILSQNSSFDDNKGFSFTLYSIKYSWSGKKISLKRVWTGFADCFVSDCFFTKDGVCIGGGTKDDTKNNAYYITAKGIHKCFSTAKNSDFLRILNTGDCVYAFLSGRDKSKAEPVIYRFNLDNYIEGNDPASYISLYTSSILSPDFDCFFGYGFVMDSPEPVLVMPASIDGVISFVCYNYEGGYVSAVIPDATGCVAPLGNSPEGFWYLSRDPLIEGSFYGISLFTGTECKKIKEIF